MGYKRRLPTYSETVRLIELLLEELLLLIVIELLLEELLLLIIIELLLEELLLLIVIEILLEELLSSSNYWWRNYYIISSLSNY